MPSGRLIDLARAEVAVVKHGRPVVGAMAVEERLKICGIGKIDCRTGTTGKAER